MSNKNRLYKDMAIVGAVPSNQWVTAKDIGDRCGYSAREVAWVLRVMDQLVQRKKVHGRQHYRYLYTKRRLEPMFFLSGG